MVLRDQLVLRDQHALRSYYETEASRRLRGTPRGWRVARRDGFIAQLVEEGRRRVIDFGSGPGGDGGAFVAAGLGYVGLDLAHGNGVAAAEAGRTVVQASIAAPPVRAHSFDAAWSMSVLMHLADDEVGAVVTTLANCLEAGSPIAIGVWGGDEGLVIDTDQIDGEQRPFHLRSEPHNRSLVESVATVEHAWTGPNDSLGWEYHLYLARIR